MEKYGTDLPNGLEFIYAFARVPAIIAYLEKSGATLAGKVQEAESQLAKINIL